MITPGPLLDRLYTDFLYPGPPRPALFAEPPGEPALAPADGISWRVFSNPVTLFVGGVLAVILELAHPQVRAGVWSHSTFRTDPKGRLQRTGLAAMVTVFAARSVALRMIEGVNRTHARVRGTDERGAPYNAADPALLTWVQATAATGFGAAYDALVRRLPPAEWDALYAEGAPIAAAYGASAAPGDRAGWEALLAETTPTLTPSPIIGEFLGLMRARPILPLVARPLQAPLTRVACSLMPPSVAARLDPLPRPRPGERTLARLAAFGARLPSRAAPWSLAQRRLALDSATVSPHSDPVP